MKSILCLLLFISRRGVQEAQFSRHLKVSNLKEEKPELQTGSVEFEKVGF